MTDNLRRHPVTALKSARDMAHSAVQLVTKAARANLPAAPDDSHSNLGWNPHGNVFYSQPLPLTAGAEAYVGVDIARLTLAIAVGREPKASLDLAGRSRAEAEHWLDGELQALDLTPASTVSLPYHLPDSAAAITDYSTASLAGGLATLAAWFTLAHTTLNAFASAHRDLRPGPSPVRCWPHHFDIATYVGLEAGDAETARGIGVGLSPGDDSYDQPYVYINPWPHLDPQDLPALPKPGHWHRDGFVGAIATAEEILTLGEPEKELGGFVEAAFAIGVRRLGV